MCFRTPPNPVQKRQLPSKISPEYAMPIAMARVDCVGLLLVVGRDLIVNNYLIAVGSQSRPSLIMWPYLKYTNISLQSLKWVV